MCPNPLTTEVTVMGVDECDEFGWAKDRGFNASDSLAAGVPFWSSHGLRVEEARDHRPWAHLGGADRSGRTQD